MSAKKPDSAIASKRALLYSRQSETSGDGERSLSLDSQIAELRRDAVRHEWVIVGEIRDADQKGHDPKRPGLAEVYARCRAGDVDIVAFWALNRLARKVRITEQIFDELEELGIALYSNQEPWVAEPMMRQVFSAFAEQQTRDVRAHVRRAVRERTRRGLPHGPAPFGYSRVDSNGGSKDLGKLIPNDDAAIVREMVGWRLAGCSETAIAARLINLAIPPPGRALVWSRQTVAGILTSPVYRGAVRLAEVEQEGAHEPIIDAETWRLAQARRHSRPRSPRAKPISSWLEGLVEHGCGAPMYLTGGSPGRPPISFRCRIGGGWGPLGHDCPLRPRQMPVAQAERMAWQAVVDALTSLPSLGSVYDRARREHRASIPLADSIHRDALRRAKQATVRRERILESYWSGSIERPRMEAEIARLDAAGAGDAALLASAPEPPDKEALEIVWQELRDLRSALGQYGDAERTATLYALGVAVVSPAGYRVGRSDAGIVTLRFRPELRGFFGG